MDRRVALSRIGLLLGGTVSLSVSSAVLSGCSPPEGENYQLKFLSQEQFEYVGIVADLILPETDSPGAKSAGVDGYIDTLLAEYYLPDEAQLFALTLNSAQKTFDFSQHSLEDGVAYLTEIDERAYAKDYTPPSSGTKDSLWLHRRIKEMVIA